MNDGLYSVNVKGGDVAEWPPGGVAILLNGVILGGGPYTYFKGSYSAKDGVFKGELIINQHTPPPPGHVFFNAKDIGMGVSGTYEGDEAELTCTALVGRRSLTARLTLRKLADI
jgi:T3SS negative regulator,GrlR